MKPAPPVPEPSPEVLKKIRKEKREAERRKLATDILLEIAEQGCNPAETAALAVRLADAFLCEINKDE